MLHCHNIPMNIPGNTTIGGGTDATVFERQQARMKWQQQQSFFNGNDHQVPNMLSAIQPAQTSGLIGNLAIKSDPDTENGRPDFSNCCDDELGYGSRFDHMNQNTHLKMTSCPPSMADQTLLQSSVSLSPKKRKTHDNQKLKVVSEKNGVKEKKIKGCSEGDSTENSSKEKSKVTEAKKPDYIHVRARRGQATDSHSLAERVRREKISERMKYLQDLVPGCNKITGKAGMLDEIISYVQSLQKQVEFLSMKLATVQPRLDSNIDDLIAKEMFVSSSGEVSEVGYASEMANSTYLQLNSLLEMGTNPIDMVLRRIGGPVSVPETFVSSSCFNQIQPTVTWDADLQNLFRMEIQQAIPYQSQKFTGSYEGSNLKMEM